MVVVAKAAHGVWKSPRRIALRQAQIRESWSPWERRERAREAEAQARFLWAVIAARPAGNT